MHSITFVCHAYLYECRWDSFWTPHLHLTPSRCRRLRRHCPSPYWGTTPHCVKSENQEAI